MHGITKKRPGPLAPPLKFLPNLNITARSYSLTILMQKKQVIGNVMATSKYERPTSNTEQKCAPSSDSATVTRIFKKNNFLIRERDILDLGTLDLVAKCRNYLELCVSN
jgi:hypothetical protein